MDMKKSTIALASSVLVLSSLLAACGGKEEAATTTEDGKPVINWWGWAPQPEVGEALAKSFNESQDDYVVKFKRLEDYEQQLQVAMLGGDGPDVIGLKEPMIPQYKDRLVPAKDYMDKAAGAGWQDKLIELGIEQTTVDGEQMAVPVGFTGQAYLMYNKTLLDKYGVTPPKTYDETVKAIETINASGDAVIPMQLGAKDAWVGTDVFNVLSHQVAPGYIQKVLAGEAKWTDKEMVETAELWQQLFEDKVFQEGALGLATYMDGMNNFFDKKAAMWVIGSWEAHSMTTVEKRDKWNNFEDEIGFVPLPNLAGGTEQPVIASIDMALGVNKESEQQDGAAAFIAYMTQGEGQALYMEKFEMAPAVKDIEVAYEDKFTSDVERESYEILNETVKNAVAGRGIRDPKVYDTLGKELQNIAGGQDAKEALARIQAIADQGK
ncbi:extracellular solute-binding protein [Exiguobacterium sp. SH5S13]|nr:extracellular solute-binding protein [Exiguobacterium sp. SH5S13]